MEKIIEPIFIDEIALRFILCIFAIIFNQGVIS